MNSKESSNLIKKLKKLKLNFLATLAEKDPETNFLFNGIQRCKTKKDKLLFISEYVTYLEKCGASKEVRTKAKEIAHSSIGYAVCYYDDKIRKAWYDLNEIRHPILGVC